ncbi:basic secretory family protein [Mucilaginibacter sp. BJC16-A38]|uniref:basic secretory family protein n=1 Tax=Mucilaginibacter phenanthrenivorans TaxID=1234842 RepID=UPI0021586827|nr:basic secretory family protein [Mucilaginibacter phenanthrenivorans]MCR8560126.1 basic secretory family protein [Mucilaginibacter phenanthrenivorans]
MKYPLMMFVIAMALFTGCVNAHSSTLSTYTFDRDSVTRGPYTLVFINRDTVFAHTGALVKKSMIAAFFKVYPAEAAMFNANTPKHVVFLIDPNYQGVAATFTSNVENTRVDTVHFNPGWMLKMPTDIDVVTHEVMHIVQGYGYSAGPWWLTEGIADYARYKFGVDNSGAGWSMPDYKAGQSYTNSYRISARFLVWIEEKKTAHVVQKLDAELRAHTFNDATWKKLTGESVDELWNDYAANPAI